MRRKRCIFPVVDATMFAKHMSIADLAEASGIEYKCLCKKLNGSAQLSLNQSISIYIALERPMPIEDLFDARKEVTIEEVLKPYAC